MERLRALPGVESVGVVNELPLDEGANAGRFGTEQTEASDAQAALMRFTSTGGDYFKAMEISLIAGRFFEPTDHVVGMSNALVSRSAAPRLFPGEDPIGKRIRYGANRSREPWLTIVGVVDDVRIASFRQQMPDAMIYLPLVGPTAQSWAVGSPAYVVKTLRADLISTDIRTIIRDYAPEAPIYRIFTMEGLANRSLAQLSFTTTLLAIASGLALVLGAVGLYGVLSYVVAQRTREIAVRMALGAEATAVRRMVVVQGGWVALIGVALGVLAALTLTNVLESLLFEVEALDAPTFVAMSGVMLAVALVASYIPASRASAVDPIQALRID